MCSERQRLLDEYSSAAQALKEIVLKSGIKEGEARERTLRDIRNAKFEVGAARLAIEQHIVEHGCGTTGTAGLTETIRPG